MDALGAYEIFEAINSERIKTMAEATLKDIREFFGMDMPTFKREWLALTAQDKAQIKAGLSDGSLTY